jgi:Arc/MetJ-type ribon-helix-helix transcriptional regulator
LAFIYPLGKGPFGCGLRVGLQYQNWNLSMKTIRITLDEGLLTEVDRLVENRFKNRTEFIKQACAHFLRYLKEQQLDQVYKKGDDRIPEELEMAEASALLSDSVMEKENWI